MDAVTEPVARPARSRIDRLEDPDTFSYHEFFHKYMVANAPCLFSAEFTRSWSSRRSWVTADNNPNWDHLLQVFGDAIVPVANCDVKEYNSNPKELLPLREYIAYWRDYIKNGHHSAGGCLYLKDWHMRREFPDQDVYDTPVFFSSDWLNEYWDAVGVDDYRFVYMGPAGSWTPFHADVFRSYSWSANICGRKKWLLLPPGQEEDLRDCSGHLPYDVTALSLQNRCPPPLEVIQEAGEVIFVPSGWHHQVYNLLILKSCTGIHYKEFYTFLRIIAEHRIQALQDGHETLQGPNVMAPGPRHVQFDLRRIVETLMLLMDNKDFQKLDTETLRPRPEDLLRELELVIGGIVTG
ncbi:2-oxoglutarate and iron-dependent oxygenase JMJD4 isoform X2 [Bufo bufo]|uniref:2-oxoglutarate and iron-dependent oxygenase JMJD4 isoform X2 n=1 Tax=Bufo bufo TaxID=8384 RepID=UPI001ABEB861|nr:2-oxoglutarate and iron-dependent oxygenase JMJD4 isoform X2 [Bufo bufo]